MAEETGIEWTDSTFNPWWGCTKISPACDHCYAADLDKRTGGNHWGNVPRRRTSEKNWNEPRRWQKKAAEFQAAHGRRQRVFCASMADVFDNQVPTEWRDDLWALIRECPDLDWLLLTKRPQNIGRMLPSFWDEVKGSIWLGTTVEDQLRAGQNIPHLLQHDSAVRFLSCEPMVGAVDLRLVSWTQNGVTYWMDALGARTFGASFWGGEAPTLVRPKHTLDWVIAGGESGPLARPSDPQWFRQLRDHCAHARVPFLFKQWGDLLPEVIGVEDIRSANFPPGHIIHHRVGKKAAGRKLDGVTHDGYPRTANA